MKRTFALIGLSILSGLPSAALADPAVTFDEFEYQNIATNDRGPITIAASREPLWSEAKLSMDGTPISDAAFSFATALAYSKLEDGDIAGLALRIDGSRWIGILVERIEPADLVAVRWRTGASDPLAGKLFATTGLPGNTGDRVRLRIDGEAGGYRLIYAISAGEWQVLADNIAPFGPANADGTRLLVGPCATDGAPRKIPR